MSLKQWQRRIRSSWQGCINAMQRFLLFANSIAGCLPAPKNRDSAHAEGLVTQDVPRGTSCAAPRLHTAETPSRILGRSCETRA